MKRISDTDSKKGKEAAHIASDVDIRVIMNFVHEEKEIEEAKRFRQMVKNSSGVETRFLGHIYFDNTVRQSLAKLTPQILDSRRSPATICLYDIMIKILGYEDTVQQEWPYPPLQCRQRQHRVNAPGQQRMAETVRSKRPGRTQAIQQHLPGLLTAWPLDEDIQLVRANG